MELIIDTKEFSIWDKEVPNEVVGYNFYSLNGSFYGREKIGQEGYPRAVYKVIVNLNGKEEELNNGDKVYKMKDEKYFIGREIY